MIFTLLTYLFTIYSAYFCHYGVSHSLPCFPILVSFSSSLCSYPSVSPLMMALADDRLCGTYLYTSVIECPWLCSSSTNGTCRSPFITDGTRCSPLSPYGTCLCTSRIDATCLFTSSIDATYLSTSSTDATCQCISSLSRLCNSIIDGISLGISGTDSQLYPSSLQL
jgi:hypothetical protein